MAANEIQQSVNRISDCLKHNDVSGAAYEFQREMGQLERTGSPADKAAKEAAYFSQLVQNDAQLRNQGFPGLDIVQNEKTVTFTGKGKDGSSCESWMTDSSYANQHPGQKQHKINAADFMKAEQPKLAPVSGAAEVGATTSQKSGMLSAEIQQNEAAVKPASQEAQAAKAQYAPYPRFDGGAEQQVNQPARNRDGSLDFNKLNQSFGGNLISGFQQKTDYQRGYFVRTDISIPANTPQNQWIKGNLPSGDPIKGWVGRSRQDGMLHFYGETTPHSTGHGQKSVPLDIPLF